MSCCTTHNDLLKEHQAVTMTMQHPSLTPRGTHRGDSHPDFSTLSQLLHRHLPDRDRADWPWGIAFHWWPINRHTGLEHRLRRALHLAKRVWYSPVVIRCAISQMRWPMNICASWIRGTDVDGIQMAISAMAASRPCSPRNATVLAPSCLAACMASITFGERPLVLRPMTRSSLRTIASTWRRKAAGSPHRC